MQKRKISASVIILFIAATTLVSGTYAWFTVGGFAKLFAIDYNAAAAGAGLEISGSANSAKDGEGGENTATGWGSYLAYDNFNAGEFIKNDGASFYSPVSPIALGQSASFVNVGLEGDAFSAKAGVRGTNYNDFSIKIRSSTETPVNAEMKVVITGTPVKQGAGNPADAGRVAVTYKGTTTVYALNDTTDSRVTSIFGDNLITDDNGDQIITTADTGSASAGLTSAPVTRLDEDGNIGTSGQGIILNDIPGNTSSEIIYVQTWLEGNDPNCIDIDNGGTLSIAGGSFVVTISFVTVD